MKPERFTEIIDAVLENTLRLIAHKNMGKYATKEDALHNFHAAAKDLGCTLGEALRGMVVKHKIIVADMLAGRIPITESLIREHGHDELTYAAIQVAVLYEMMEEQDAVSEVVETADGLFKVENECDTCSEEKKGFARALQILSGHAQHLERRGDQLLADGCVAAVTYLEMED